MRKSIGGGFHGFNERATRAENQVKRARNRERWPLTLGLVSYKTVQRMGLILGMTATLSLGGAQNRGNHGPQIEQKKRAIQEQIATIMLPDFSQPSEQSK